ncbi:AlpA family transcriptional regulator [Acinetobacter modestus]|uniref:helix-turn-helix transcriptional regulator n=1 Tax=Acinetobacter modestus TaxID=1776740 RepID=UPI002030009E|nr:AlpA family transcriptional regulator [Acinetobacter modestus]MCM1958212.1 AlpA family transcriptional regulator [Acinetobacter modestus]
MNAFTGQTFQMNQILNLKDVMQITKLGRATIYNMLNPKNVSYDSTFPKQIKLSTNRVGWLAAEVNAWIESKITQR